MDSFKWPSLNVLEKHCTEWFIQHFSTKPFIPSVHDPSNFPETDLVDVVLIGRLHEEILSYGTWPGSRFRLWALSSSARRARIIIGEIAETDIGVLPRYELFPLTASPNRFPEQNTKWSLVYSGRISKAKGFGTYLNICSELQESGEDVTPVIFGVLQQLRNEKEKLELKELSEIVGSLKWKFRPQIHLGLAPNEWQKTVMAHPVLFNFSTFINDDFGVSAAQAQQAGWPLLLSDWGGHRDIIGSNVRKFRFTNDSFPGASEIMNKMRTDAPQTLASPAIIGQILQRTDLGKYAFRLRELGIIPYKDWPSEVQEKTRLVFNGEL